MKKAITSIASLIAVILLSAICLMLIDRWQSQSEIDMDSMAVDPDALVRADWKSALPTPKDMVIPLMPFQEEGITL